MKLRTQHAIVGFCPDLTSASAKSRPVAILTVAEIEGGRGDAVLAAAVGCSVPELDPISQRFLSDVPRVLKDHMIALGDLEPDDSLESVLHDLHHSLRNSLHVSSILPASEREIAQPAEVYQELLRLSVEALNAELTAGGYKPVPAPPLDVRVRKSTTPPRDLSASTSSEWPSLSDMSLWKVRRAGTDTDHHTYV